MNALPIEVDRASARPIYLQIVSGIRKLIQDGRLSEEDRLPSIRVLATELGVNRNTVGLAYTELESVGAVETRVGSGTFVAPHEKTRPAPVRGEDPIVRLERALARRSRAGEGLLDRLVGDGDWIDLGGMVPDSEFFPAEEFSDVLTGVIQDHGPSVLDYGSREGYPPLRSWLAERLARAGAPVDPEDVLILNGSQQGLDLVGKLLFDEGDRVIIESPTYYNAIGVFRLYGVELVSVPLDQHGLRPDLLEEAIARRGAKLIYCMPTFQNPTGISMPRERRLEILEVASRYGVPVLEDHFDSDLRYRGDDLTPLRGLPGGENVLVLGTFSKILFPGLRLGWLAVPPVYRTVLRRIRAFSDLAAGSLAQVAIHRFCEKGLFDLHVERVRVENRRRLAVMLRALKKHFPDRARWTDPDGGMSVWVTLPRSVDVVDLLVEARRAGVNFTPGPILRIDGGGANQMRLCFTLESEARIRKGVEILAGLVRSAMEDGGRRRSSSEVLV